MNDAYFTQIGERPDLAAIEVNAPEGYIGSKIIPTVPVMDKSGTIYYATLTADAAAQTGRSAATAPTATQISDSSTTFTTAEAVKRAGITPDEAKQMGGIDKADEVGTKWAKRQVLNAKEESIATSFMDGAADNNFDPAKLQTDVQVALQAIRLYHGRTALVTSTKTVKAMVQGILADATHGPVLARLITGSSPGIAATGLNLEAWVNALALWLGVDEVLAGDDTVWNAAARVGRFAIVKLDDTNDPLSHKYLPVLGKTYQFLPDGMNDWLIQTNANRDTVNNTYDAFLWYDVVILNTGGYYLFDGVLDA